MPEAFEQWQLNHIVNIQKKIGRNLLLKDLSQIKWLHKTKGYDLGNDDLAFEFGGIPKPGDRPSKRGS